MRRTHHEIHRRRRSRNVGVGLTLGAFVLIIFGVTVAKLQAGRSMEAFDHGFRASVLPAED